MCQSLTRICGLFYSICFSTLILPSYVRLNEVLGVARGIFFNQILNKNLEFSKEKNSGYSRVPSKNVSPFGPAVWQAIGNIYIYTNVLFYYIDDFNNYNGQLIIL